MKLLVLAHEGTDRDLLETALVETEGAEYEFIADWETFMSRLLTSRPPIVILAHSTLTQAGDAGIKAADMMLRALSVPTVVALSEANKHQRFPLEMETEFEHFVIEPYGPLELRRAICTAMEMPTNAWPVVTGGEAEASVDAADAPVFNDTSEVSTLEAADDASVTEDDSDSPAGFAVLNAFFESAENLEEAAAGLEGGEAESANAEAASSIEEAPSAELVPAAAEPADAEPAAAATADDDGDDESESAADDTDRGPPITTDAAAISLTPLGMRSRSVSEDQREAITVPSPVLTPVERTIIEPRRSESTSSQDVRVSLALPDPNTGDLGAVQLPRVLYALAISQATGELHVRTASLERRYTFLDGEPGTVNEVPTTADESNLLSVFQWSSGTYEFRAIDVPKAQFRRFGEPLELLARGIERHFGLNETATALGNYLKNYPVVTDQFSRFARVLGMEGFSAVVRALDGQRTLEEMMMSAGMETESVLRHIFFGWLTGVLVFEPEPCEGPIKLTFDVPAIMSPSARPGRISTGRQTTVSGIRSGSYNALVQDEYGPHSAVGKAEDEAEQREMFERLQEKLRSVSTAGNYEMLGLAPGCGEDEVNRKFYELAREFHPDRFARSHNEQIRALAEKLFVHIRRVHGELMEAESTDIADLPPRQAAQARAAAAGSERTENTDPAASVARRRQRARELAMSGASSRLNLAGSGAQKLRLSGPLEAVSGDSVAVSGESRTSRHAATSSMRRMKPDQLFRNARAATEQGNFDKAIDLLTLAQARGQSGNLFEAYHVFLRYTQEEVDAEKAIERLDELIEALDDEGPEEYSMALTLAGHACRLEDLSADARKYYRRATRAWPANESASRWLRHLNKRTDTTEKQGPFSSTFLNKLFTSGKSK